MLEHKALQEWLNLDDMGIQLSPTVVPETADLCELLFHPEPAIEITASEPPSRTTAA